MLKPIPLQKYRLASDRTATLTVGTNYTPRLASTEVETTVHLFFGSTLGVNATPLRNFLGEVEGIALHLQGTENLDQLTDALEVGSRVLRWQAAEEVAPLKVDQWGFPDERRLTVEEELAAIGWVPNWAESNPLRREEQCIIELIILFGSEPLPDGTPVATYLVNHLADYPLRTQGCAELWLVIRRLAAGGIVANGQSIWKATTAKQRELLEELTPLHDLKRRSISPYWDTESTQAYYLLLCQIITAKLRQVIIESQIEQSQAQLVATDLDPAMKPILLSNLEHLLAEAAQWSNRRADYLEASRPLSQKLSAAHCTPAEELEDDEGAWQAEVSEDKGSGDKAGTGFEEKVNLSS